MMSGGGGGGASIAVGYRMRIEPAAVSVETDNRRMLDKHRDKFAAALPLQVRIPLERSVEGEEHHTL